MSEICNFNQKGICVLNSLNIIFSLAFFVCGLIFYAYPEADIYLTSLFYSESKGFLYSENFFVEAIFIIIPKLSFVYGIYLLVMSILHLRYTKMIDKALLYALLFTATIISSGLIVNYCFKDHFGRARPKQITEFGGNKIFTEVFVMSDQCNTNCSFSSGHAAGAFIMTSTAFLVPKQYQIFVFFCGILFGMMAGTFRVLQGAHFPSDILISGSVVLLTNFLFIILYSRISDASAQANKIPDKIRN